jgi:hypothetical protein
LTPELAEVISRSDAVVFVDAGVNGTDQVCLQPVAMEGSPKIEAHRSEPAALLKLADELFGNSPPGWLLTIPAYDLGFGRQLSVRTQAGLNLALGEFQRFHSKKGFA